MNFEHRTVNVVFWFGGVVGGPGQEGKGATLPGANRYN